MAHSKAQAPTWIYALSCLETPTNYQTDFLYLLVLNLG
jgi:hypothetical protein